MIRLSRRLLATGGIVLGSLLGHSLLGHSLMAADPVTATQAPKLMSTVGSGLPSDGPPAKTAEVPAAFRGTKPFWIWGAEDKQNYTLKTEFTVPAGAKAIIRATCDNQAVVKINDTTVVARCMAWEEPVVNDMSMHLKAGVNVLEAAVTNEGGVAGFLCQIEITDAKGVKSYVISDDKWEAVPATKAGKAVPARKVGPYGAAPWNKVFEARNAAAESNAFYVKPGFQVEKLFTVPKDKFGSWVNMTFDPKGRIIASDQGNLGLYRITPPKVGSNEETKVEKLDVKMSAAQGLLFAFDSLYVVCNGGPGGSGLYRLRDTKGTDQFDEVTKLKSFAGGGEHGPHAVRLSPDGKSLFVIAGNHTLPPEKFDASRLPSNWSEDHLLPRQWDANGHARGILAPGGWVAKTDPDGKTWEIFTAGYRNPFDFAFNADGEMFVYDADMEWDIGSPWYRPTRVNHASSGSELGWRSGTGKWPAYYPDSLPAMVDIGPGSPVGVEFGYGTKFPAKYQKALFILDWTFGTIYTIHTEPEGSSYKGHKEEFLSRTPLPLTDVGVGADGNLYFTVGGRGTQSELYRVTYAGKEPTDKVDYKEPKNAEQREIRHQIEAFHTKTAEPAKAVEFVFPYLKSEDRFLRYAARVALEHQPVDLWAGKVLSATDTETLIGGTIGLAHQGSKELQPKVIAALKTIDFAKLDERHQIDYLRALSLVFLRMGEADKETAAAFVKTLDPMFPGSSDFVNRELCQMLVYLKSPTIIAKTTKLLDGPSKASPNPGLTDLLARNKGYGAAIQKMIDNGADMQKVTYIYYLRNAKDGWTMDQRKSYFAAIGEARTKSGGNSYQGFLNNIEKDNFDNAPEADRLAIEAAGLRKPFKPKELPKPKGPGKTYTMEDLLAMEGQLKGRNYANGLKMFSAAQCVQCHRFYGDGGSTGPDLTQSAGRFSFKDMAESIILPSKVVSDQYRAFNITTTGGKKISGKIVTDTKDLVTILTDPIDSTKIVEVKRADIDEIKSSAVSMMPENLFSTLNENEVLDLMAYLLSRGDPNSPMFKK